MVADAEDFSDGRVAVWKLRALRSQVASRLRGSSESASNRALVALLDDHAGVAARDTMHQVVNFRYVFASEGLRHSTSYQAASERDSERDRLTRHLRDVFGNPFHPKTINPIWPTLTVTTLAQSAYDERIMPSGELDTARLAVLSDALEETGCDDADILDHLRGSGPHVRGCWVLDLLLGKE